MGSLQLMAAGTRNVLKVTRTVPATSYLVGPTYMVTPVGPHLSSSAVRRQGPRVQLQPELLILPIAATHGEHLSRAVRRRVEDILRHTHSHPG